MKLQHTKLVLAGVLMMGGIGLLPQPILSQPSRPDQSISRCFASLNSLTSMAVTVIVAEL